MEGGDAETMIAYYCFVNLGWPPSKYAGAPYRDAFCCQSLSTGKLKPAKNSKSEGVNHGDNQRRTGAV